MTQKTAPTTPSAPSPAELFSAHPGMGEWLAKTPLAEVFKSAVARGDVAFMDGIPPEANPEATASRPRRNAP